MDAPDPVGHMPITKPLGAVATWVCCHLGAREHYAVPRALSQQGRLGALVTDVWVKPHSVLRFAPGELSRRARERFHPDLANADVRDFTLETLARESFWRARKRGQWDRLTDRNRWFQQRAVAAVSDVNEQAGTPVVLFAHSYSARDIFSYARSRGWTTVLGQIDPGEEHFRIVRQLATEWNEYGSPPEGPPDAYFEGWREECALADWIVVNSNWAREALERAGVPGTKLRVVALPFEPEVSQDFERKYPSAFSAQRPLRVLFVGQVAVAKGAAALLEAVGLLEDVPLEITVVGKASMAVPSRWLGHPSLRWLGAIPRSEVMAHYRAADLLVFPSFSDGFGMAQVEAQGWRLPVIASRFCGQVVRDGVNGILLQEVSAASIAKALRAVASQPELLAQFSRNSNPCKSDMSAFASGLLSLEPARPSVAHD